MADERDISAESFADMAAHLHDESGVEETVELVLQYALKAVGCDYASLTVAHRKRHGRVLIEAIASTDSMVAGLDALPVDLGEGPDLEVLSEDEVSLYVRDTALDRRWPRWAEQVASRGIRSLLLVRLHTAETTVGALNLFGTAPEQFDTDDQAVAKILARHAAVAIGAAQSEASLWHAVDARKVVGQAQGILMERFDLDADAAFSVLMRYSQNNNMKLRAVAEQLISTRSLPD